MAKAIQSRSPGYETRGCTGCGGVGIITECGNGPHDRPETVTCAKCEGVGEASVFVYGTPAGRER